MKCRHTRLKILRREIFVRVQVPLALFFIMKNLNQTNTALIEAFNRGYRIIDNIIYNPKGEQLRGYIGCDKSNYLHKKGYYKHSFSIKSKIYHKRINILVCKLVAYQKFGLRLFGKNIEIRHLDGNSLNNRENNIAIGTHSQNMFDIPKEIRIRSSINASSKTRKFSDCLIKEIKDKHSLGVSYKTLMKEYNISSKGTMSFIIHNKYVTKK